MGQSITQVLVDNYIIYTTANWVESLSWKLTSSEKNNLKKVFCHKVDVRGYCK